jgi:coenzyme F420-0:L-glutamate ligase / coenzyme F420-1:gamma-L-glutamate ligase
VVRGADVLVSDDDGPGAAALLRPAREDWFRYGQVEAVTASLGLDPATVEPPTVPPGSVEERFARALAIALRSRAPWMPTPASADFAVEVSGASATIEHPIGDAAALGALAQRIAAACWAEDLAVELTMLLDPAATLRITAVAR